MTVIRYARVLGGAAALLASLSACADARPCAGVGTVSGVSVYFVQDGYDRLPGASWKLCTRGECVEGEVRQESVTKAEIRLPDDVDPDAAPVRFSVTRNGAATAFIDDSVELKLRPQSDGCGGGSHTAALAFTKETGLRPDVPEKVSKAWFHQVRALATATATATP
ncbi:hypothetical protein ACWC10_17055 [Streptomyces sp. NPDC001595]|uniref:hypothetical protein n=1 Tax=Streptomyces sp. NPDC001532 TaxID=3154520 RepID=UPI00331AE5C1